MWKILMRINKNLVYAIPLFMLGGFLFGGGIDATIVRKMKLLIIPLTFLMVYPMMVTLNIKHLKQGLNPKLQGTAQFINFALIPFIGFFPHLKGVLKRVAGYFSRSNPIWPWDFCLHRFYLPAE